MVKFYIAITYFFITGLSCAHSQQLLSYNTSDGLPQPFVYCIQGDSIGKVWMGTGNGLASFNGKTLTEERTPFDAGNRFITSVMLDRNKQLWFGHFIGNVSTRTSLGWKLYQGVSKTKVVKMIDAIDGPMIVHQNSIGQLQHDSILLLYKTSNNELQFQDALIFNSQLFIATNDGLWRYFNNNFEKIAFEGKSISALHIINDRVIVGLTSGKLYSWKLEEKPLLLNTFKSGITSVNIFEKSIWIGTKEGVFLLNENWKIEANYISDKYVTSVFEDVIGNTWISTYGEGVYCISNEQFTLLPNQTSDVISDDKNGFFVAENNTILQLNWIKNAWNTTALFSFSKNTTISKLYFHKDNLFIGTLRQGVFTLNLSTLKLTPFEYNNFLLDKNIHDFIIDEDGNWWISASLSGVLNYNPTTGEINFYDTSNGLTHNDIYHLLSDREGDVWMASKGSGIARFKNNKFEYYSFNEGLNGLDITGLTLGLDNKVTVSSSGGGLSLFQDGLFRTVTYADGLPSNFVQNISHISNGNYWLSTSSGLCQFDAKNLGFKTYNQKYFANNIAFNESNIAVNEKSHSAAFINNKGLLMYRKVNKATPYKLINLNIESVTSNGVSVDFKQKITLPYKRQDIVIKAELISYGQSTPIGLEYKLYGSDSTWTGPLYQNTLNFSGLRDDSYQISVRILNRPNTTKTIKLTILQPFWKTWWFICGAGLIMISLVYLIFKIRMYRLKQYNKELEGKVIDRTMQLSNRNKQLEQFTYTVSHDLKNPAINLVELIKILNPNMQDHPDHAIFGMLEKTANNMYNTLIELLNVLKATHEKGLKFELLNIQEIIDDTCISIKHSIEKSNAQIDVDLKQKTTIFHKPHLQSIVYNLVSNAIKYQKPNIQPEIKISTFKRNGFNCIEIADNGLGMNLEQDGDKLFGMFQRMHDHVEGTGVGLHLIHSIVVNAGGKIDVKSQLGEGTTFTVFLPESPKLDTLE